MSNKRGATVRDGAPGRRPGRRMLRGGELWVALLLIATVGAYVFWDYLSLNALYLFTDIGSDSINETYPQIKHVSDYLRQEGLPRWSFNQGMGQNVNPFSLGDPFTDLLYLFGDGFPLALGWLEYVKVLLGGLFFALYLRTLGVSRYAIVIGSLLFAFCGFMILGGGWYVFSTEAVYGAFLLYAYEQFLGRRRWALLPLAFAALAALQPFDVWLFGLLLLAYGGIRHIEEHGWRIQALIAMFARLALFAGVGVAIGAVFFFSNLLQMLDAPRVVGDVSYAATLAGRPLFGGGGRLHDVTAILRLFSNDMLGTGSDFRGWLNYLEAPMLYCGLLTLLVLPQGFCLPDKRRRVLYATLVGIFVVPVIFPYFRWAFYAFTGDYYRVFSLCLVLTLLYTALRALSLIDRQGRLNLPVLIGTLGALLALLYLLPGGDVVVERKLQLRATLLLLAEAGLLCAWRSQRYGRPARVGLLLLVLVELGTFSVVTTHNRDVLRPGDLRARTGYNDYTVDAIAYLKSTDPGFYRVNKDYSSSPATHASINDAKVQGYYGTLSYHSFNQRSYIEFLQAVGNIREGVELDTRWAFGLASTPLLQTWGSVKYYLVKDHDAHSLLENAFEQVARYGDVTLYRNTTFLPLGFAYGRQMDPASFAGLNRLQKQIALLNACVVEEDLELPRHAPAGSGQGYSYASYVADATALRADTLHMTAHSQNHIAGEITLQARKLLFFSIPYDRGWRATVNGKPARLLKVNVGFMGLLLEPGRHEIQLNYFPPLVKAGFVVSVVGLMLYAAALLTGRRRIS